MAPAETLWYRGEKIEKTQRYGRVRYTYLATGEVTDSMHQARIAVNSRRLWQETDIRQTEVVSQFAAADQDNDGDLSWQEIEAFQSRLVGSFAYRNNDIALRPEAFYREGGGDCEDFSLVTCALLTFWGIDCAVGILANPDGTSFHAVALIRVPSPPAGYVFFDLSEGRGATAAGVGPGIYVPIDYQYVGAISSAAGPDWVMTEAKSPVDMYDTAM